MFIFCVFLYGCYTKTFLSPFGWSQSPSANLVLFWFGLVQSHRKKNVSRNGYPPDCVLTVYSKSYLDKLLKLQKRVLRFIYFSDHNQHAIPLFSDAGILPLQFSYYDLAANLMLDIRRRSAPRNIRDLFEDISNIHS